jgi:endo-1,4-beta-D-glucanase Y
MAKTASSGLNRRRWLHHAALLATAAWGATAQPGLSLAASCTPAAWPLFEAFLQRCVQDDGRVVDISTPQMQSTSEGQAYGMFFALVANRPERFEAMWRWAVVNLAGGDISSRLPAWQWGLRSDGTWGVLDYNPASDADLWMAYALLEASRLWGKPAYQDQARVLLARISADEVLNLPGLGAMLMPAPVGFHVIEQKLWRLNPSYLPVPVLRRLAVFEPSGPWREIANNTVRMLRECTPFGYAADWVAWQQTGPHEGRFVADPQFGDLGSYDAIRCYLWAGITAAQDPAASVVQKALQGMSLQTEAARVPPEKVQAATGVVNGSGPVGFSAAVLPLLMSQNRKNTASQLLLRVQSELKDKAYALNYYDHALCLFGLGFADKRFSLEPSGRLQTSWEKACATTTKR